VPDELHTAGLRRRDRGPGRGLRSRTGQQRDGARHLPAELSGPGLRRQGHRQPRDVRRWQHPERGWLFVAVCDRALRRWGLAGRARRDL